MVRELNHMYDMQNVVYCVLINLDCRANQNSLANLKGRRQKNFAFYFPSNNSIPMYNPLILLPITRLCLSFFLETTIVSGVVSLCLGSCNFKSVVWNINPYIFLDLHVFVKPRPTPQGPGHGSVASQVASLQETDMC